MRRMNTNKLATVSLVVLVLTMVAMIAWPTDATVVQSSCNCGIVKDCSSPPVATSCNTIQCETVKYCDAHTAPTLLGLVLTLVIDLVAVVVDLVAALTISLGNICVGVFASLDVNVLLAATCSNPEYFIYKVPGKCTVLVPTLCGHDSYYLACSTPKTCTGSCVPRTPPQCTNPGGIPDKRWIWGKCGPYFNNQSNKLKCQQIIAKVFIELDVTIAANVPLICAKLKAELEIVLQVKLVIFLNLNPNKCTPNYPFPNCYFTGTWTPANSKKPVDVLGYQTAD